MNSQERHERRYLRRKEKRARRKQLLDCLYGNFDRVFTFEHLYSAYKACCKGVGWKASTQRYKSNALINVVETLDKLHSGKYKSRGFNEFDIMERGKLRHIKSVHISERVVQRCLCDYSLVPVFSNSFIYDNGACIKNKGIDFAIKRLVLHLKRYWAEYGSGGYALVYDFSKYFDSIDHEKLKKIIDDSFSDKRLSSFIKMLVDDFGGDKGLGLGSQISQVSALRYPSRFDHYAKEVLQAHYEARYMDDGYIIHRDKEFLRQCLEALKNVCDSLSIKLNVKKTQIVKLSRGITFLKHRFILTESGRVIIVPARKGSVRMRRKLKKFKQRYDGGKMPLADILQSYKAWRGHTLHGNAVRSVKSMDRLFYRLFFKEKKMKNEEPTISVENICGHCEKGPCNEPCWLWYRCLQGEKISWEELLENN